MAFHSILFLFTFFPLAFAGYFFCPKKFKNIFLVFLSLFFYSFNEPLYIFYLLFMIGVNYFFAKKIVTTSKTSYFVTILLLDFFFLFYFKYYGFFLETVFSIVSVAPTYQLLPIPLGISFLTFTLVSYQIDVYRQKEEVPSLIDFSLYVCFFPKIMMGPIVRYKEMKQDLKTRVICFYDLESGIRSFIIGFSKKVILADTFGNIFQALQFSETSALSTWLALFAFTFQIYFDFSGYSDMAIGLGNLFGFHLPKNFNYPYISKSIKEFWSRWHMTLSRWFRDYLYIPLGGNRGSTWKWVRNIFIVWLATGLWHGEHWNFILWGFYFGIFLILEKKLFAKIKIPSILRWGLTFLIVMFSWILFFSTNLQEVAHFSTRLLGIGVSGFSSQEAVWYLRNYGFYYLFAAVAATPLFAFLGKRLKTKVPQIYPILETVLYLFLLVVSVILLLGNSFQSFFYERF